MNEKFKALKLTMGPHAGMYFKPIEQVEDSGGVRVKYQSPDSGPRFSVFYRDSHGEYTLNEQRELVRIAFSTVTPIGLAWSKKNGYNRRTGAQGTMQFLKWDQDRFRFVARKAEPEGDQIASPEDQPEDL